MKRISILGCGWLGKALGLHFLSKGHQVKASRTQKERLAELTALGFLSYEVKIGAEEVSADEAFFDTDVLLLCIPPKRRQEDVLQRFPKEIEQLCQIAKTHKSIEQVLFCSASSVYSANEGVYTEESELEADTDSGRALIEAEKILRTHFPEKLCILRLAGLFGPERDPSRFFGNSPIPEPDASVNMVHQEDCIRAIELLITKQSQGTYNLCSPEHPSKREFYSLAFAKAGKAMPLFGTSTGKKRMVSSKKIQDELGYRFLYENPSQAL